MERESQLSSFCCLWCARLLGWAGKVARKPAKRLHVVVGHHPVQPMHAPIKIKCARLLCLLLRPGRCTRSRFVSCWFLHLCFAQGVRPQRLHSNLPRE